MTLAAFFAQGQADCRHRHVSQASVCSFNVFSADVFDAIYANQRHGDGYFLLEQVEQIRNTVFATGGHRINPRPAYEHTPSAQGNCLDHINSTAHPTVKVYLCTVTHCR